MHMFHSGMMAWLVTVQLFCCGMDGQFVAVRTRADKKNSLLKKENIKESLVLAVLYAHQKKTTPYIITIPQVSRQNDILERDITILNDLIDKRDNELKFYVQNLSYN